MKRKLNFSLLVSALLLSSSLYGVENSLDIDSLLDDIENKTDLSEQTKLENSGISFVYTRNDIERMQVRYLKDILKLGSIFGYTENRYGLPDPLTHGDSKPFMSSSIRIFIDNQEIIGGMYGSGLILYGDLDLEFVDHIEIYTQSPTYEYSTEPTIMLIKLYSKTASKDEGTKVELLTASHKSTRINAYTSSELANGWSYFSYVSRENLNRRRYKSFDTELSRDKQVGHIFTSFQNENNHINIDFVRSKRDGFAGPSFDATPIESSLNSDSLHIGYDADIDNFSFLLAYDYLGTKNRLTDDNVVLSMRDVDTTSKIFSTEFKYKKNIYENSLIVGAKYRYKKYNFDKYILNNIKMPLKENKKQSVVTLFIENQYFAMQNLIVTAGLQGVYVNNKDAINNKESNLLLYRFGMTYLSNNFIFKTVLSHSEAFLEPYLIDSPSFVVSEEIAESKSDTIYENIIYQKDNNRYELVIGYQRNENYLLPDRAEAGKLNAQDKDIEASLAIGRWEHKYNKYDKLFTEFSYLKICNIGDIDSIGTYKVVVRNLNSYNSFDIFNEIVYDRNDLKNKNFYDYSTGVTYHHKKYLNFAFKAENLFDKADVTSYSRIDVIDKKELEPLTISPIDRRFTVSMEYMF